MDVTESASTGKSNGAFFNPKTYAAILYLVLLSLPLGIIYFTVMVTGLALSIGLTPIFIGIPLFFGVAKLLNEIVKFEQGLIRHFLGLPTSPAPVAYKQQHETGQNWLKRMAKGFESGLFIRNMLLVLFKFATSIIFFAVTVTVLSIGLGSLALPVVHIILMKEIQIDILEDSLFSYFQIDWTYNQQYIFYVLLGIVFILISLRTANGLMQVQRKMMYVDEPNQRAM